MSAVAALQRVVDDRIDGGSIDVARVLLGVAAMIQAAISAPVLFALSSPTALRTPMVSWMPVLPETAMQAMIAAWLVLALFFAVGLRIRLSGSLLVAILAYSIVVDQQSYSNHVYLMVIVTALVSFAGPGPGFSMDAVRGRGQTDISRWPVDLVRIQLSIVYLFAAISKLNVVYLSGAIIAANLGNSWLLPVPEIWIRWEIMFTLAMVSILTELFLALAFWSHRYRRAAWVTGVGLHLFIVLAYPLSSLLSLVVFSLVMFAMYAQFFSLDAVVFRRLRVDGRSLRSEVPSSMPGGQPTS